MLDMIWTSILSTWEAVRDWFASLLADPSAWTGLGVGLVIALLILVALAIIVPTRPRDSRRESRPELLISRGEVRSLEESSLTELDIHVSNLGEGVVQLLEIALATDLMPTPQAVELSELVDAHRSVDVTVPVDEIHGDAGYIDLFFYIPQTRRKAFRLRANMTWEPWEARFKVEPLEQRIDPARRLASSRLQQRQRDEWRKRQRQLPEVAGGATVVEPDEEEEAVSERPSGRDRLEFPSDF